MEVPTARVRFPTGLRDRVALAESVDSPRIRLVGVPREEAVVAVDRVGRADDAGRGEVGRLDPAPRGEPGVEPLVPRAVREELQRPGRLAPGDAERVAELVAVESPDHAGGGDGAEGAAGRRDVEAAVVVRLRADRLADRAGDVVAGGDAREEAIGGRVRALRGSERGRDRRSAGMQRGGEVGVVEIEAVCERAVRERGVGRRHPLAARDDGRGRVRLGVGTGSCDLPYSVQYRRRGVRVCRASDRHGDPVEEVRREGRSVAVDALAVVDDPVCYHTGG